MRIYSYVVRRDLGFAPNPFHGYCTLATCRPDIRGWARVGDWILGTGSASKPRLDVGRLIYAMKVEEILTFNEYFKDSRFSNKKPDLTKSRKFNMGDNIYYSVNGNDWDVLDSHHYREGGENNSSNIIKDTSNPLVLISQKFSYFGTNSIEIPENLHFLIKSGIGCRSRFSQTETNLIVQWLESITTNYCQIMGLPADWKFSD